MNREKDVSVAEDLFRQRLVAQLAERQRERLGSVEPTKFIQHRAVNAAFVVRRIQAFVYRWAK